ncbi:MAG: zinc ribbon domain-containing protein [Candidatus Lokiarchaeota archaeon]|nr:zinc ribbon domain-containing protein [Candidatus Harpocratesius repetitus]
MKYEKNQYSEGFSYCSLIIGGAFAYWGITTIIEKSWIGLIWIGIALSIFSTQYYAIINRKKLRRIVLSEFIHKPNVTLEEIQDNTGISKKDIKAIILDLRASGDLQGSFSETTGEMQLVAIANQSNSMNLINQNNPVESPNEELIHPVFCKECGTKITEHQNAKYCPYCGSTL